MSLRVVRSAVLLAASGSAFSQSVDAPPSTPGNVRATLYDGAGGELSWARSTDDRGAVRGYEITKNGQSLGIRDALSFYDPSLLPGVAYTFTVVAIDGAGQRSGVASASLGSAAPPPVSSGGPAAPAELRATRYSTRAGELFWQREPAGLRLRYEIRRDGRVVGTTNGVSYYSDALAGGTDYAFEVIAIGRDGGRSAASAVTLPRVGASVGGSGTDRAPAAPAGLRRSIYSITAAELFWDRASTPGLRYEVRRDGEVVRTGNGTSYFDATLREGRPYRYEVIAIDSRGRRSAPATLQVATGRPAAPTGFAGEGVSPTTVRLTWDAVAREGLEYEVSRRERVIATVSGNMFLDEGLVPGRRNGYRLVAIDPEQGARSDDTLARGGFAETTVVPPLPGTPIDLADFPGDPSQGLLLQLPTRQDRARAVGDVDGDGLDDVLFPIDARRFEPIPDVVLRGSVERRLSPLSPTALAPGDGYLVPGSAFEFFQEPFLRFSPPADVNGDGIDDLVRVVHLESIGEQGPPWAQVVYGRTGGFSDVPGDGEEPLEAGEGVVIENPYPVNVGIRRTGDGSPLRSVGDLDGDGDDELVAVLEFPDSTSRYRIAIVRGAPDLPARLSLDDASRVEIIDANLAGDGFEIPRVSGIGDVDGDGFDDLGIVHFDRTLLVLYGRAGPDLGIDSLAATIAPERGFRLTRDVPYQDFGLVFAAGDVNGDGFGDVVFGTGEIQPLGSALLLGTDRRPPSSRLDAVPSARLRRIEGQVYPVGDIDGDGVAELFVVPDPADDASYGGHVLFDPADGTEPITGENLLDQPGVTIALNGLEADWPAEAIALGDIDGDGVDDAWFGIDVDAPDGPDGNGPQSFVQGIVYGRTGFR